MRSVTVILWLALIACSGTLIFVQGHSEDDAEEVAADPDADEEDSSEDDAEELAADPSEDEQDTLVDNLLLNRALRGAQPMTLNDLDFATIAAAKKKAKKAKKAPKKKKAKKAKKAKKPKKKKKA